ncbi:MAG: hypothetical protein ABFS45_19015 [Pseudomonadota bacterium]
MNAIAWLDENAPGFRELSTEERNAIMEFSLLWSLFEAKALNTQGNATAILAASLRWAESDLLTVEMFEPALTYFRNRYYNGTDFTYHFDHLHRGKPIGRIL